MSKLISCPLCDYGEMIKQEESIKYIQYKCDCCNYKTKEKNLQLNIDVTLKDDLK